MLQLDARQPMMQTPKWPGYPNRKSMSNDLRTLADLATSARGQVIGNPHARIRSGVNDTTNACILTWVTGGPGETTAPGHVGYRLGRSGLL